MTTYSFAQLEQLWIQAGGSQALAPLMAGVAEVESGGNPDAYNPSGASGLWQIEIPVNASHVPGGASNVFNALDNAKAAVSLSGNTMSGIQSNWLAFEPSGAAQAIAAKNGGTVQGIQGNVPGVSAPGAVPSGSIGTGDNSSATSDAVSTDSLGVGTALKGAEGLLHGVATMLDYIFGMFGRGQGWRLIFTLVAASALFMSYRELSKSGVVPDLIPRRRII